MRSLHEWSLSYAEARDLQTRLAGEVQFTPLKELPRLIVGLDCAFSKDGKRIFAAAVMLEVCGPAALGWETITPEGGGATLPLAFELEHVETVSAEQETRFPYIPGLLSFREAPVCLEAVGKLSREPDLYVIDGQGVAHPRRLGLAAHLGLFFDKPTVGCAKSRLIGTFDEPSEEKGAWSPLRDGEEVIGAVVRTRSHVKPVFVSVGHRCLLEDAVRVTLACTTRYRIPEPTRLAHQVVSRIKLQDCAGRGRQEQTR
ncbi:MAG TPA: endonuclease V [Sedimentisphaerales bacterium]|jgi:deoxyribonuclease V|nr:endonuclease V [Sedimentisphaerales bacterium]HNU28693.1 endonuclease V [Sedimentisphaerales bacterium]